MSRTSMRSLIVGGVALLQALVFSAFAMSQQDALEQDARLVELMGKAGADFSKSHRVDYFFWMPTGPGANAIATELAANGYEVKNIQLAPRTVLWEVQVQRVQLIKVEEMQATTRVLTELARRHGGEYDGWGVPVGK